jgi:hypothetical protein
MECPLKLFNKETYSDSDKRFYYQDCPESKDCAWWCESNSLREGQCAMKLLATKSINVSVAR